MRLSRLELTALAFAVVGLSGCHTKPQLLPLTPTDLPLANYAIGETKTATPGGVMVERIEGTLILPGYRPVEKLVIPGLSQQPPDSKEVWAARYQYQGTCAGAVYLLTSPAFYKETIGIAIAGDGVIPCAEPVVQILGSKAGRTWPLTGLTGAKAFTAKPFVAGTTSTTLRWQLLYGGRSGNEVLLDYREFADVGYGDQARPAYYQQVKYDLSLSKTVNFRDTQIEILDASNAGVKFRVLHDRRKAQKLPGLWGQEEN